MNFIPYPHRLIFNRYYGKGTWVAGKSKSLLSKLLNVPPELDSIQEAALQDGIFFSQPFQPYHLYSSNEAIHCLQGRKLYFVGDSYMQQMYIGMGDILLNDPSNEELDHSAHRSELCDEVAQRLKDRFDHLHMDVRFIFNECRQGDIYCFIDIMKKNPSLWGDADSIVMGTLVHHLNIHRNDTNLVQEYMMALSGQVFYLRDHPRSGYTLKLTWATGPSYDLGRVPEKFKELTKIRPSELLNFKTIELSAQTHIPLLDFYTLTGTCAWSNCTKDGGHRSRFVNRMKAQMLLNNLCEIRE